VSNQVLNHEVGRIDTDRQINMGNGRPSHLEGMWPAQSSTLTSEHSYDSE
jgi:hypothetical protein